jgi:hypothetical protein
VSRIRPIPILVGVALLGILAAIIVPQFAGKLGFESLNPLANLKVGDTVADVYLIVVSEKKSDVQGDSHTLPKYSQNTRTRLTETMSAVRQNGPWWVSVGKHRAIRYEIYGTSQDGMNVAYLHTIVETPEYFHQVVGWAQADNYQRNLGKIRQVADSLREDGN